MTNNNYKGETEDTRGSRLGLNEHLCIAERRHAVSLAVILVRIQFEHNILFVCACSETRIVWVTYVSIHTCLICIIHHKRAQSVSSSASAATSHFRFQANIKVCYLSITYIGHSL